MERAASRPVRQESAWTFLTNHSHVLLCIVGEPAARMRDVAVRVGITERAVQRIVADLEAGGYLRRLRDGRCNRYEVLRRMPLRHPLERHRAVADLIDLGVPAAPVKANNATRRAPVRAASSVASQAGAGRRGAAAGHTKAERR